MNILVVCLGNICRSPLAEGILKQLYREFEISGKVESCGLMDWNAGNRADQRAVTVAAENGIDIKNHRARQIHKSDFKNFDLILVMDSQNEKAIFKLAPLDCHSKIRKITEFDSSGLFDTDIEDPYHSDDAAFRKTFQDLDKLCRNLVKELAGNKKA